MLLANASNARKKQLKSIDEAEALQYLRSLQGDILIEDHITDTQITKYGFAEIELNQVLQKFWYSAQFNTGVFITTKCN
jgi:hypothetical protein